MKQETFIKIGFWSLITTLVALCSFYIMHNAAWLLGDDCQTLMYTGWDEPIFGFFVSPTLGRFFPLDYTIYDVLCLFYKGQIPPSAHYFIHVICFIGFVGAFIGLSFFILKNQKAIWKYVITLMVVVLVIGRTYINFAQCWTGIWTIHTFLALFLYCNIKFVETKKWIHAIIALLSINYILYYYETMFIIPLAIGICSLIFSRNQLSRKEITYYMLLIASGLLFLALYAVLVLPKVENFYGHHLDVSPIANAAKMFYAQKLMWISVVFLLVRLYHFLKRNAKYCIYDSLLLASCAFFCGSAFLNLDFTLYYVPGSLVAIPSILYFSIQYLKEKWTLILFIVLALFYGRKIPKDIRSNQKSRIETYDKVHQFIQQQNGKTTYFYEPLNESLADWQLEIRKVRCEYLETVAGWYMRDREFEIIRKTEFNNENGLWQVVTEDQKTFLQQCPSAQVVVDFNESKIYKVNANK